MKICFAVDDTIYRPGGVQYNVLKLAEWFIQQGHSVAIFHSPNPSVKEYALYTGIEVIPVAKGFDIKGLSFNGSVSPFPGFGDKKKIKEVLLERDFDVVYFNYPFSPFISSIVAKTVKKLRKQGKVHTKLIATVLIYVEENLVPKIGNKVLAWINKTAIKSIDVFTHCSAPAREYVDNYLGLESVYVPLCTTNVDIKDKFEQATHKEKISILFLGRLELRKGVIDFIEALNTVPKELLTKVELTIAGDGIQRQEAESLTIKYKLPITFLGRVNDEQKHQSYLNADIAVFPAKYGESFGIVLTEAMSYGCAILGYANAGYAFTMAQYKDECLVEPGDINGLGRKITDLIQNQEKTLTLGKNLKTLFEQTYEASVVGGKLLELVK